MKEWIDRVWEYIRVDFEMARLIPDLITREVMFRIIGEKLFYTISDAPKLHKINIPLRNIKLVWIGRMVTATPAC